MRRSMYLLLIMVWVFGARGGTQGASSGGVQGITPGVTAPRDVQGTYEWAVIGAGPAGIVTVGVLMDLGVSPQKIAWIDPEFMVGRLGQHYASVPGNTKTKLFVQFMQSCKTFLASNSLGIERLQLYDPEHEYSLYIIIEPLQDITDYIKTQVAPYQEHLKSLDFIDDVWRLQLAQQHITSKHVVLALGAHPRSLHYTEQERELSLDIALNKQALAQCVTAHDTVAVVGSAHSAVLVMKFLSELQVGRIINLYTKPLQYAVDMGSWVLHASDGLKGVAAEWARNVLEKNPPANLIRFINTPELRQAWLPICTKIIYAAGYERNELPPVNGSTTVMYDELSGMIAPRLFGIGIAFPELHTDPMGRTEHRIGLNSFMEYAQRVIPQWAGYRAADLSPFAELFDIAIL